MTKIIAEIGINHNGYLDVALKLVDEAARLGAQFVKFQTFNPDAMIPKALREKDPKTAERQYQILKKLALSKDDFRKIHKYCKEKGIIFLSTPFDMDSLDFLLKDLGLSQIKLGSSNLTDVHLLMRAATAQADVIISTGLSSIEEISLALGVLAYGYMGRTGEKTKAAFMESMRDGLEILQKKVTLLHCTADYPSPYSGVNLHAIKTMWKTFSVPVGFSDHTEGVEAAIGAVALGARMVEKHLTLNRTMEGPDHASSLDPAQFKEFVQGIRNVQEAMGDGIKKKEAPKKLHAKTIVAACHIRAGEVFTESGLKIDRRPGSGLSPFDFWEVVGQKAKKAYAEGDLVEL